MAMSKQVVGNPTPRVEGELKVSGEAKYAVDITRPRNALGKIATQPDRIRKNKKTRFE